MGTAKPTPLRVAPLWVRLASTKISVCLSAEHCIDPVLLVNSTVVEQGAGLAPLGTFLNTADIVAGTRLIVSRLCVPPESGQVRTCHSLVSSDAQFTSP